MIQNQRISHNINKNNYYNNPFFTLPRRNINHDKTQQQTNFVRITWVITMTSKWARWRLKSPALRLCTQPFIQAQIKTSKLRLTGLCAGNSPVTGEFPVQMAGDAEIFPFDDVIMDAQCTKDVKYRLSTTSWHGIVFRITGRLRVEITGYRLWWFLWF